MVLRRGGSAGHDSDLPRDGIWAKCQRRETVAHLAGEDCAGEMGKTVLES